MRHLRLNRDGRQIAQIGGRDDGLRHLRRLGRGPGDRRQHRARARARRTFADVRRHGQIVAVGGYRREFHLRRGIGRSRGAARQLRDGRQHGWRQSGIGAAERIGRHHPWACRRSPGEQRAGAARLLRIKSASSLQCTHGRAIVAARPGNLGFQEIEPRVVRVELHAMRQIGAGVRQITGLDGAADRATDHIDIAGALAISRIEKAHRLGILAGGGIDAPGCKQQGRIVRAGGQEPGDLVVSIRVIAALAQLTTPFIGHQVSCSERIILEKSGDVIKIGGQPTQTVLPAKLFVDLGTGPNTLELSNVQIDGTFKVERDAADTITLDNVQVTAGASQLVLQQSPTSGTPGQTLSPSVKVAVEDAFGNVVTSDKSTVTIAVASGPGGFTAGSTTSVAAVSGVATFSNLILGLAGTYTLKATDGTLASVTSGNITVGGLAPPSITAPTSASVSVNGSLVFSGPNGNAISITDNAAGQNADSLTLTVAHGIVTLGSTTGLSFSSGSNGTASFTVKGTLTNLDAALSSLTYQPAANYSGSDTLAISVVDSGDGKSGSASVALTVSSSAPSITAPASESIAENTSLVFSTRNGSAISINDVNTGGDSVALSVAHGTLTLATTTGLTFTNGTNGSGSFTVKGALSNLSAALDGLVYQPTLNYSGSDSLSASIKNLADNMTSSTSVILNIGGLPTVLAPSSASLTENTALTFSSADNNEITVADQSAGSNPDSLTVSVSNGTVTLGSTTGLTFTAGANGSHTFTVSGTLGNLTVGVNGLTYQPNANFAGSDSLVASLFNPRNGLTGKTTVPLTVNAVTAPKITAPTTATVAENGTLVFSTGNGNAISLADNGAGGNADSLTMTVAHGILTLGSTTGLIFSSGSNGSASFTVKGTLTNLEAALSSLTYQPAANYAGSDTLAISLVDSGDGKSGSASVALTV